MAAVDDLDRVAVVDDRSAIAAQAGEVGQGGDDVELCQPVGEAAQAGALGGDPGLNVVVEGLLEPIDPVAGLDDVRLVLAPAAMSSCAPTRVKMRSTSPIRAERAGTNEPIWAISTISPTCRR